jgi:G3E family GTPase
MSASRQIPVTVLTGYLGAGKTTLLNRILSEDHGRRYAVIVNEFGEIGIDGELIIDTGEELFQMSNGCVCCTVRGDLIRTLHTLLAKPGTFDAIIIETTGLADPGPVIQSFLVDPALLEKTRLDSVTTVVDAKHVPLRIADSREAREQIALADQIVLNKTELVTPAELDAVEAQIGRLNPLAPIHRAQRANVPLSQVLGQHSFDLERIEADISKLSETPCGEDGHVHDEHCGHDHPDHDHHYDHGVHETDIFSISLTSTRPMDLGKVTEWLQDLTAAQGRDILRIKGIIDAKGEKRRLVVQAVHMLMEGDLLQPWAPGAQRTSRLVFIGRHLDRAALQAAFDACAA